MLHASDDASQYEPIAINIHGLLKRKLNTALIGRGALLERVEIVNYRPLKQARVGVKSSSRLPAPTKLQPSIKAILDLPKLQPVEEGVTVGPSDPSSSSLPLSHVSRRAKQIVEDEDGFVLVDDGDLNGRYIPEEENGRSRSGWYGWWRK
jgi:hypothetical protein